MTKHIKLKTVNQGTALATGTPALPPLVIEGLEEFKGSFDRLCLQAGTAPSRRCLRLGCGPALWQVLSASRGSAGPSLGRDRQRGRLVLRQGCHSTTPSA